MSVPTVVDRSQQPDRIDSYQFCPLVSVILPTLNGDAHLLERSVESVLSQHYADWQLCISDDWSDDDAAREHLVKLASVDRRISLTLGHHRSGVSETLNRALEAASGSFIVTLGQSDELHPAALLEVIRCLNERDDFELIYSDEDIVDGNGEFSLPASKPAIDLEMLASFNYVGHLAALRRSTVLALGGFRSVCDGAQDWDLLLRLLDKVGPGVVHHIAKPLYHCRIQQESAVTNRHKPSIWKASVRALSDHAEQVGRSAVIEPGLFPGSLRMKQLAPQAIKVAVFLRAEDGGFQIGTVRAVANHGRDISIYQLIDCAVHLVDPGSSSGDLALIVLSQIPAEVLVFINRPLESLNHAFFEELAAQALRPDCGLVTGISVDAEGRVLDSGFVSPPDGQLTDPFAGSELSQSTHLELSATRSVETISCDFFAIRREHLVAVGGLSSVSSGQMTRLVDKLVLNAKRNGLRVIVTPFAVAGFYPDSPSVPIEPPRLPEQRGISLDPNLLAFGDQTRVIGGIV